MGCRPTRRSRRRHSPRFARLVPRLSAGVGHQRMDRRASTVVVGTIFTVLFLGDGLAFLAASLHGWPWFMLIAVLFVLIASTHLWLLLRRVPPARPLGPIVGVEIVIAGLPLAVLVI